MGFVQGHAIRGRRAMARETSMECNVVGSYKYVVLKVTSYHAWYYKTKSLFTARNTTVEVKSYICQHTKSEQVTYLQNDSASSDLNNKRPAYIGAERSRRPAAQTFAHGWGDSSSASRRGDLGLTPDQSMKDLWWKKRHSGTFFFE